MFARRFDGDSKGNLTYILFGTEKQQYLVHFLTDDENSFDQIVAVSIDSNLLKKLKNSDGNILVTFFPIENSNLVELSSGAQNENNKFSLPTSPLGQKVKASIDSQLFEIKIEGLVYFNDNRDLKIN